MAFDIYSSFWSSNGFDKFNVDYEKLFIATTEFQDVVTWAVGDKGFGTDSIDQNPKQALVDFLIDYPDLTEEQLQQLRNEFINTITPTLQSLTAPI